MNFGNENKEKLVVERIDIDCCGSRHNSIHKRHMAILVIDKCICNMVHLGDNKALNTICQRMQSTEGGESISEIL